MSRLAASLTLSSLVAAVLVLQASPARAQPVSACKSSYETAQELRADHRYAQSLRELDLCLNACPRVLAADCQEWKDQLTPLVGVATITLTTPDGSARIFTARIDGEPIPLRTGQSTVRLDPGEHVLELTEAGFVTVRQPVSTRAGATTEVRVDLRRAAAGTSSSPPGGDVTDERLPIFPFVLGGVGAAVLTAGVVLGVHGQVKAADLRDTCAKDGPFCARDRVDAIETEWQVGAVLASAGAAMLGVAIILYVVDASDGPSAPVQASASGIAIRF